MSGPGGVSRDQQGGIEGGISPPHAIADGPPRTLNLARFCAVAYFLTAGGAYGIEDLVGSGGPGFAMLAILVIPWIFALPIALMTAELATMFPDTNGGYIVWVREAFGPFWAFQEGFLSAINSVLDCSLYPVMFMDYLSQLSPGVAEKGAVFWAVKAIILTAVSGTNLMGVEIVGTASVLLLMGAVVPTFLVGFIGLFKGMLSLPAVVAGPPPEGIDWSLFLATCMWNFSGWESVGNVAGNVKRPGRTFPRGVVLVIVIAVTVYVLPVAIGVSVAPDVAAWEEGFLPEVAAVVGGQPLKVVVVLGALIASYSLFQSILCTSSFALAEMGKPDLLDLPWLCRLNRRGAPGWAIAANAAVIAILSLFSFQVLVEVSLLTYSLSQLPEMAACVWLRVTQPDASRPYRMPLPVWGMVAAFVPPTALFAACFLATPVFTKGMCVLVVAIGAVLYPIARWRATRWPSMDALNTRGEELLDSFADSDSDSDCTSDGGGTDSGRRSAGGAVKGAGEGL